MCTQCGSHARARVSSINYSRSLARASYIYSFTVQKCLCGSLTLSPYIRLYINRAIDTLFFPRHSLSPFAYSSSSSSFSLAEPESTYARAPIVVCRGARPCASVCVCGVCGLRRSRPSCDGANQQQQHHQQEEEQANIIFSRRRCPLPGRNRDALLRLPGSSRGYSGAGEDRKVRLPLPLISVLGKAVE